MFFPLQRKNKNEILTQKQKVISANFLFNPLLGYLYVLGLTANACQCSSYNSRAKFENVYVNAMFYFVWFSIIEKLN